MHGYTLLLSLLIGLASPVEASPSMLPITRQQGSPVAPVSEERYEVFLLTIEQGDDVWERFGHNAILIRDRTTDRDLAWNWGLYNFADPGFLSRFLRGTMRYTMAPAPLESFLDAYRVVERTVYANQIHLTHGESEYLNDLILRNFEPENREYVYHYFLDNCSTRVRDALDATLRGILKERFADATTAMSYRWHTRRLVQETGWIDQGLSFLLGTKGDTPGTEWEAMFIPMEMMRLLEGFERPDGAGGTTPLLGPRQVLVQTSRPTAAQAPRAFSPVWLLPGLGAAALFLMLGAGARKRHLVARSALAAVIVVWGGFSGVLGGILVSVWFTDHDFIQWNVNILQMNPLALPLAALTGLAFMRIRWMFGGLGRTAAMLALLIAGLSVVAGLLQITSVIQQGNAEVLAIAIPTNVAIAVVLARATQPSRGV